MLKSDPHPLAHAGRIEFASSMLGDNNNEVNGHEPLTPGRLLNRKLKGWVSAAGRSGMMAGRWQRSGSERHTGPMHGVSPCTCHAKPQSVLAACRMHTLEELCALVMEEASRFSALNLSHALCRLAKLGSATARSSRSLQQQRLAAAQQRLLDELPRTIGDFEAWDAALCLWSLSLLRQLETKSSMDAGQSSSAASSPVSATTARSQTTGTAAQEQHPGGSGPAAQAWQADPQAASTSSSAAGPMQQAFSMLCQRCVQLAGEMNTADCALVMLTFGRFQQVHRELLHTVAQVRASSSPQR